VQIWAQNAKLAGDYAASGTFDVAMQLLNQQIGAVNFEPLQAQFMQLATGAWTASTGLATLPALLNPIHRNFAYAVLLLDLQSGNRSFHWGHQIAYESSVGHGKRGDWPCLMRITLLIYFCSDAGPKGGLPVLQASLDGLVQKLQGAYGATTQGQFSSAMQLFNQILQAIPLLVVESKKELNDVCAPRLLSHNAARRLFQPRARRALRPRWVVAVEPRVGVCAHIADPPITHPSASTPRAQAQQLVSISREYLVGLQMEMKRKELPKESADAQKLACELAAYFTHCNLQPVHLILTVCTRCGHVEAIARKAGYSVVREKETNSVSVEGLAYRLWPFCLPQLRTATNSFFKIKNYKTAASFARRLLELGPPPQVAQQVRPSRQGPFVVCRMYNGRGLAVARHARMGFTMEFRPSNAFNVVCPNRCARFSPSARRTPSTR
jgi:hypothetical protein